MFNRTAKHALTGFLMLLMSFGFVATIAAAPSATIEVSAPDRAYRDYPISVVVSAPAAAKSAILTDANSGQAVACQLWRDGENAMLTWIVPELQKGSSLSYKVAFSDAAPATPADGVVIRPGDEAADIQIGGSPFTRYIIKGAPKPYCYPVLDAAGDQVTRDFPMKNTEIEARLKDNRDHPHQRSLWFTHGSVNGVDFWSEGPKAGKTVHRAFPALEGGPVMGRLCALTDWQTPDGAKVCEDERDLRFYKVAHGRLFDWNITIKASEGPTKFGDTKEGMFGFRVASTIRADSKKADPTVGGKVVNSEGQTDDAAWGRPANWVDYYGPVQGKTVGITVFDHPQSFRHPTYWHVRTYGLFAANPFGIHDFPGGKGKDGSHTIEKGQSITFRYRILIHEGTTKDAGVAEVWDQFANPPKVTVK
jgi:hypothetical protein